MTVLQYSTSTLHDTARHEALAQPSPTQKLTVRLTHNELRSRAIIAEYTVVHRESGDPFLVSMRKAFCCSVRCLATKKMSKVVVYDTCIRICRCRR